MKDHTTITLEMLIDGKKRGKGASKFTDGLTGVWIPHSQIQDIVHLHGQTHEVTMTEWIAKEKGLI